MKNPSKFTPIVTTSAAAIRYQAVKFLISVNELEKLPLDTGREVAVAGRSNAGKSSALNVLTGQRQLARVSKTPGRTQLINFFLVEPERYLVDLPGYGYAQVPDAVRRHWQNLLEQYLHTRATLCGLLLLMDIRHPLTALQQVQRTLKTDYPQTSAQLFSATTRLGVDEAHARLDEWLGFVADVPNTGISPLGKP